MSLRSTYAVVACCFLAGMRRVLDEKVHFLSVTIMYIAILLIYGGIIRMIPPDDLAGFHLSHEQMIWYLATTEFVLFTCSSWEMKMVQAEFMSGQAELALLRPFPDSFLRIAEWGGEAFVRVALMLPVYLLAVTALTGAIDFSPWHLIGILASLPAASFLLLCSTYMIGASCLWFIQAEPVFWIWQKSMFLFGALLWPLVFYPFWLQGMAWATPFPAILTAAGNWTLTYGWGDYALGFLHQILWVLIAYVLVRKLDRKILARIQKGGV